MIKSIISKIITTFIIFLLITIQPGSVLALDAPTPPPAPTMEEAPTPPPTPTLPSQPTPNPTPSQNSTPTPKPSKTPAPSSSASPSTSPSPSPSGTQNNSGTGDSSGTAPSTSGGNQIQEPAGNSTGGQTTNGGTGDTTVATGNATNSGTAVSTGNNNAATSPSTGSGSGATVANTGNGADSTNSASVGASNSNTSVQDNSANVQNDLQLSTTTGDNSLSKNTGGDATLVTGDANTSGTVLTAVNTNVNGVAVAEFNVADNHTGDIILDFNAGCVSNCVGGSTTAANTGNGADSTNSADVNQNSTNNTFQNNDANVGSNLTLVADSGSNTAAKNTGGDSTIVTGDANVAANVLTFANNNIAGNVIYGVVNIFGNLVGDIILPESAVNSATAGCSSNCTGGGSTTAANTGNGADSTNSADVNQNSTNNTFQANDANIQNNLLLNANSGDNLASKNTDGSSNIVSGDTNVKATTLNVANSNISGGNVWLVIVNEAGKWIGKIMGAPEGSNMAGSVGTEFVVDEQGQVTAVINSGNGAGSDNSGSVNQNSSNTTSQTNNADIVNNVNLAANTGNNNAAQNTGGNSTVYTGDANIIANLVNYVNNNIAGDSKLIVTVVNVFGSWVGDFITPGQSKQNNAPQGGTQANQTATQTPSPKPTSNPQITYVTNEELMDPDTTVTQDSQSYKSNQRYVYVNNASNSQSAGNGSFGSSVLGMLNYLPNQNPVQVAGIQLATSPSTSTAVDAVLGAQKKAIKINLALLVIILPALVAGFILLRKTAIRRQLAKLNYKTLRSLLFSFF
jgi:hypothetical protein